MAKSEFGKGLSYCLGLFLAHAERHRVLEEKTKDTTYPSTMYPSIWFNGASDHLYELQWQSAPTNYLKHKLKRFQEKCLDFGHGKGLMSDKATKEDVEWAIKEAKTLLRLLDKAFGIPSQKGEWQ